MARPQTILLTGVTGFVAKRVALDLLRAGHVVRGSLRSMGRAAEVRNAIRPHLTDGSVIDRLGFVELDLLHDEGWDRAMQGVDALVHTASPFPMTRPKDAGALIRPAVDGTVRALTSAHAAGVARVVLTSSMAAVMNRDVPEGHVIDESDWTDPDHRTATAYDRSKTLAERAAWDFATSRPGMRLTTIAPGLVLGRPLDDRFGTSIGLIRRIMDGRDRMVPDVGFPVVDLADVSQMHVEALKRPATAGRRYLAAAGWVTMSQMARWIAEAHPERRIATRIAPRWALTALSLFDPSIRMIRPVLGRHLVISNERARSEMKIRFVPPRASVEAAAAFLAGRPA